MCKGAKPQLLLVCPGNPGRRPVLESLVKSFDVILIIPASDKDRSLWALDIVSKLNCIDVEDAFTCLENASKAIDAWLDVDPNNRHLDGCMTYDEFALDLCASIAEHLGLPFTPLAEVQALRCKPSFRERCRAAGVPAVRNCTIRTVEEVDALIEEGTWRFPSILKPAKGAGSWHTSKVASVEELRTKVSELTVALSQSAFPEDMKNAGFALEEFFEGHEVDVDGWVRHGRVEYALVSDNRPALEPFFLETGGFYPSQLPEEAVVALKQLTSQVVEAFPGFHGCFHFEAKINLETMEVMPIELNARCGGAECPASVQAVTGYNLPQAAAYLALNLPVVQGQHTHAVVASTNFYVFESGTLTDLSDAKVDTQATKLVVSVLHSHKLGHPHVPNNGSASCLGWMACGGDTAEEAERNLQLAISHTRIEVVPN